MNWPRVIFFSLAVVAVLCVIATPALILLEIWGPQGSVDRWGHHDDRFGATAGMTGVMGVISLFLVCMWGAEGGVPPRRVKQPRLDRTSRRKLREEQRRIALAQAIEDAEREAGLR